jgi:CDP-diglyceride synthetase
MSTYYTRMILLTALTGYCTWEAIGLLRVGFMTPTDSKLMSKATLLGVASLMPCIAHTHALVFLLGCIGSIYIIYILHTLGELAGHPVDPPTRSITDEIVSSFHISSSFDNSLRAKMMLVTLWVILPLSSAGLLHNSDNGLLLTLLVIFTTAVGENGGLFGGYFLGTTRPFPEISPNKTTEGFACQVLTSVATSIFMVLCTSLSDRYSFSASVFIGLAMGFGGIVGDLLESYVKRIMQTKDAGTTLPGWGGLLDRLDGMIINFPLLFIINMSGLV